MAVVWSMYVALILSWLQGIEPTKANSPHLPEVADAIATASEGDALMAARLVSLAHYESNVTYGAIGDHGRSVGVWQTPKSATPKDVYGQAKLASRMVAWSLQQCGNLNLYASGMCGMGSRAAAIREKTALGMLSR